MGTYIKLNQKIIYKIISLIMLLVFLSGCSNSTEPGNSDELRLILTADKYTGNTPLTVRLAAKIVGNTNGISGHVPDYYLLVQDSQ